MNLYRYFRYKYVIGLNFIFSVIIALYVLTVVQESYFSRAVYPFVNMVLR